MVILENNKIYPVYCMLEYKNSITSYSELGLCTIDKNDMNKMISGDAMEIIEEKEFKGEKVKFFSSVPEINYEIYQKIINNYFETEMDLNVIKELKKRLPEYSKKILENYYKYKIQRQEFGIWKNNFEDLVYETGENEYYIDDKEFDIFYKIKNNNEYEFEFIDK